MASDCVLVSDLTRFIDSADADIDGWASLSRSALASCSSWVPRTSLNVLGRAKTAAAAGAAVESGVAVGGPRDDNVSAGADNASVVVFCFLDNGERCSAGADTPCPGAFDEALSGGSPDSV